MDEYKVIEVDGKPIICATYRFGEHVINIEGMKIIYKFMEDTSELGRVRSDKINTEIIKEKKTYLITKRNYKYMEKISEAFNEYHDITLNPVTQTLMNNIANHDLIDTLLSYNDETDSLLITIIVTIPTTTKATRNLYVLMNIDYYTNKIISSHLVLSNYFHYIITYKIPPESYQKLSNSSLNKIDYIFYNNISRDGVKDTMGYIIKYLTGNEILSEILNPPVTTLDNNINKVKEDKRCKCVLM